jgi:hypothetical protein
LDSPLVRCNVSKISSIHQKKKKKKKTETRQREKIRILYHDGPLSAVNCTSGREKVSLLKESETMCEASSSTAIETKGGRSAGRIGIEPMSMQERIVRINSSSKFPAPVRLCGVTRGNLVQEYYRYYVDNKQKKRKKKNT